MQDNFQHNLSLSFSLSYSKKLFWLQMKKKPDWLDFQYTGRADVHWYFGLACSNHLSQFKGKKTFPNRLDQNVK